MQFPATRLRRTRMQPWSRALVAEHQLTTNDLIWPVFVIEGENLQEPIISMPGVYRYSIDRLMTEVREAQALGIQAIALFPVIAHALKTDDGQEALNPDNLICRTIRALKAEFPMLGIICDVALDPYTTHGHDGLVIDNEIANDATVAVLVHQALNQVKAGCDVVAPSDMQDGRIGAIRHALESAGYPNTLILSYTAKYASAFYGPFRTAIGSQAQLGQKDKKSYQQDPANSHESLREALLDIKEGADILMVKPGMPYLDIIYRMKTKFQIPVFAYQVSGEYSMLATCAEAGHLDFNQSMLEALLGFKRAGADAILTYAAKTIARLIA